MSTIRSLLIFSVFLATLTITHPAAAERCSGFDAAMAEVEQALAVHEAKFGIPYRPPVNR